jgi:hypothetical protein
VAQKKRSKTQNPKKKSPRLVGQKGRPGAGAAKKSDMKAAHHLDEVVKKFEGAVDGLQSNLEQLRETLPELVSLGVRRDRLRRIKALADDGILDSLQRLATALEDLGPSGLPEALVPHHCSARMAFDHVCRAFEVQAVYQPGASLTVTEEQLKDFDWSADHSAELNFTAHVEILRSGWKAGEKVFVLPRVRVR